MLKTFAQRHHLALQKGNNLRIFCTLATNHLLWMLLQLHKKIKGIRRPIVHYYAVCWNEETILPWMFDYYGDFVDRFFIYDNYSSDTTEKIIKSNPKATIIKFGERGKFDDSANQRVKNECWKQSRGKADLVVVCDMDEFLYHNDLKAVLEKICERKVSFPTTVGYEMYNDRMPEYDGVNRLPDLIKNGVRSGWLDKHIIFDPHRIVDVNFDPGAHHADPTGIVRRGDVDTELKLLHYKNMGIEQLLSRYKQLRERLSDYNIANGLGIHYYEINQKKIEEQYAIGSRLAEKIVD